MFKKILIPLDGSDLAEAAIGTAREMLAGTDAQLLLLQVMPALRPDWYPHGVAQLEPIMKEQLAQAHTYIRQTATRLEEQGYTVQADVVEAVDVAGAILDYAALHHVDLLAISSHGRSGLQRWLLGSVADKIIHASSIPVLLIRPDTSQPS